MQSEKELIDYVTKPFIMKTQQKQNENQNGIQCAGALILLIVLFILSGIGSSFASEQDNHKSVLVLYSYQKYMSSNILIERGIRETFKTGAKGQIDFYTEYMDSTRFSGTQYIHQLRELYRHK